MSIVRCFASLGTNRSHKMNSTAYLESADQLRGVRSSQHLHHIYGLQKLPAQCLKIEQVVRVRHCVGSCLTIPLGVHRLVHNFGGRDF